MKKQIKLLSVASLLLILILMLSSCQGFNLQELGPKTAPTSTTQSTGLPNTGNQPYVIVSDQNFDGKTVIVDKVFSVGPGWIAIHRQSNGIAGDPIGHAHVQDGLNTNVAVTIDQSKATPVMYAMLHNDGGQVGVYEFPGPDTPVMVNGQMVAPSFKATLKASSSQGTAAPTTGGMTQAQTTPGASGVMTPTASMPMTMTAQANQNIMGGSMVEVTPKPGSPAPDLQVSDQQVQNGQVLIDKVISAGPGWVVVYDQQNGQPTNLLGYTHLNDGVNQNVVVMVDQSKVTPVLYAFLMIDAGKVGTFEFPGADALVHNGIRMVQGQFNATSAAKETVISSPVVQVRDQGLRSNTVIIDDVYSDGPGWIGIHASNPDGSMADLIGYTHVKNGENHNVIVKVDPSAATQMVYAVLHLDLGKVGVLEYPGPDEPALYNGDVVMGKFNITSGLPGQDVVINASTDQSPHLTDQSGMSLYVSTLDSPGKSNCTGKCKQTWLPVLATGKLVAGSGVDVNKLSVILLPNGDKQVTYGGLPLYYYSKDTHPGDVNGQGIDGQWFTSTP